MQEYKHTNQCRQSILEHKKPEECACAHKHFTHATTRIYIREATFRWHLLNSLRRISSNWSYSEIHLSMLSDGEIVSTARNMYFLHSLHFRPSSSWTDGNPVLNTFKLKYFVDILPSKHQIILLLCFKYKPWNYVRICLFDIMDSVFNCLFYRQWNVWNAKLNSYANELWTSSDFNILPVS